MRYRTIRRRLRLSCLNDKALQSIYKDMLGKSDDSILTPYGKNSQFWLRSINKVWKKKYLLAKAEVWRRTMDMGKRRRNG